VEINLWTVLKFAKYLIIPILFFFYLSYVDVIITSAPAILSEQGQGGGDGGVAYAPPAVKVDLSFEPQEISVRLNPGEKNVIPIKITNNGDSDVSINIVPSSEISNIVSVDQTSLIIKSKSQEIINVKIEVPASKGADVIVGNLDINAPNVKYRIKTAVVILSQAKYLLDVKVTVPDQYKKVIVRNQVLGSITIYNLGQEGRVDVNLTYGVRNSTLIKRFVEALAIGTQTSILRDVTVPREFSPGTYQFFAIVYYATASAESDDTFEVIPTPQVEIISLQLIATTAVITIFPGIFFVILPAYRKKKRDQGKIYGSMIIIRRSIFGEGSRALPAGKISEKVRRIGISRVESAWQGEAYYRRKILDKIRRSVLKD